MNFTVRLPFFNNFTLEEINVQEKNVRDIIVVLKHKMRPTKTCLLCLEKDIEESTYYGIRFEILSARHVQGRQIPLDWMPISMISSELLAYWTNIMEHELFLMGQVKRN